ncbi:MAG: hypothetical protein BWY72_01619 [Bacteroidetes bacterium ADurb.Bin416]|nr:MAG: hypothetical protein BWY72_01619 [Bacteroidetes bacterium ADurb.Bin416]
MTGHSKIPPPLSLSDQLQGLVHLLVSGSVVPGCFGHDVSLNQLRLQSIPDFQRFILVLVHKPPEFVFRIVVTRLAGAGDVLQGTDHLMVAELNATVRLVRHVAISTGKPPLRVRPQFEQFVIGMLRLQHGGLAQTVHPVDMPHFVVIRFHGFNRHPFVPGEGEVFAVTLEIILHVALRTGQRTHVLRRSVVDGTTLTFKCFNQSRPGDGQAHGLGVVAISTAHRVSHLRSPLRPFGGVERLDAFFMHQPGHIRPLARPTGARLDVIIQLHGRSSAQRLLNIIDSMAVPPWRFVIHRKSVPGPQHDHRRPVCQHIVFHVTHVLTGKIHVSRFLPGLVFPGVIDAPNVVVGFVLLDLYLAVVEHTGNLSPAFRNGGSQETNQKNDNHDTGKKQPSPDWLALDKFG